MSESHIAAQRLSVETGILAGHLANLFERVFPDASWASEKRDFLQSRFKSVAKGHLLEDFDDNVMSRRPKGSCQPFDCLIDAFELPNIEIKLCLLAGMPEEHEGFAAIFRALHPRGEPHPTIGLAAQLFSETIQERIDFRLKLETSRVLAFGILRITDDVPFFERSLELAVGLWSVLAGSDIWPDKLPRLTAPVILSGLDEWLTSPMTLRAAQAIKHREQYIVLVTGDTEDMSFHRAMGLVSYVQCEPSGFALSPQLDGTIMQAIMVHTLMRGNIPVFRINNTERQGEIEVPPQLLYYPGSIVLCVAKTGSFRLQNNRPLLTVTADKLSHTARRQLWREVLPEMVDENAYLAARYPLEPVIATLVAMDLQAIHKIESKPVIMKDVHESIKARLRLSLASGVELITPVATWDDLVLPKAHLALLHEACNRLLLQDRVLDEWGFLKGRIGSRGVRMLFVGPSGTGKTLAAEVLAHALSVDLIYVDISKVVSKWVGETEQNLAAIFEAAECSQTVLFFDEADALFGKRTEVSDARDHYANQGIAYLLTRLERFEGLTILSTNLRQNIDAAFTRRLEFTVNFDVPHFEERLALWQVHVPKSAPLSNDVDLRELAESYPVTGSFIRNAAVAAGFLAASDKGIISQEHFIHAIQREYLKSGRVFPGAVTNMRN